MGGMLGFSCTRCDWSDVLADDICPKCGSHVTKASFSGQGKIDTFTIIRYPPEGFEKEAPYVVALIDLDQGPRVIARIVDASENLQLGQTVFFSKVSNGCLEFKVKD
jgi:uncharacterized OB-fold protein